MSRLPGTRRKAPRIGDVPLHADLEQSEAQTRDTVSASERHTFSCLSECNRQVEEGSAGFDAAVAWNEWLWRSDPHEPCTVHCSLNRNQLLGLLLAKYSAIRKQPRGIGSNAFQLFKGGGCSETDARILGVVEGKIESLSLRKLRDSVQNLQVQWARSAAAHKEATMDVVDALFHRFGQLARLEETSSTMDDRGSVDESTTRRGLLVLSNICLRRFLCTFLVFYRHLYIAAVCEEPVDAIKACPGGKYDTGIKTHHILAGMDDFNNLSMQLDLMPAARLLYMHDFPGMYNAVSQVVYFNNQHYERRRPFPKEAAKVSTGEKGAIHLLSASHQLYPDVEILFEDDHFSLLESDSPGRFRWLMVASEIYLLSPENKVFASKDLSLLVLQYTLHARLESKHVHE